LPHRCRADPRPRPLRTGRRHRPPCGLPRLRLSRQSRRNPPRRRRRFGRHRLTRKGPAPPPGLFLSLYQTSEIIERIGLDALDDDHLAPAKLADAALVSVEVAPVRPRPIE